jgi:RimJ/RimL family protein N-acetyltransferase
MLSEPAIVRQGPVVDDRPARRPASPVLAGRVVTVTRLDAAAHGEALYAATHGEDAATWQYMHDGPFADREAFEAALGEKQRSMDPCCFSILDRSSGEATGYAAYLNIRPADGVIEVGSIVYGRTLRRTAGATEAMYLLARHAFETLGYRRYEWKCNTLNEPSVRAALRLGFTFQGVFRQHMIVKGRSRDTAWFSMLDGEWPMRREALERWLDPSNFDDRGRQRRSLAAFREPWPPTDASSSASRT